MKISAVKDKFVQLKDSGALSPKALKEKMTELFVVKPGEEEASAAGAGNKDLRKMAKDFWYGKPHEERRLGDLYIGDTGLYKHREWRGFVDTMYYFNMIWLYNYGHMISDIIKYGGSPLALVDFLKGTMRYRWMGQTYLTVMHWFDRGLEGMRGPVLRGSAWHYRGMVSASIQQIVRMFCSDKKIHGGRESEQWKKNINHNETVSGSIFYPFRGQITDIPLEMIPYFVSCHVNNHTVLNYIDAAQSIGLPADPCPMCQAEYGLFVLDDYPDTAPTMITSNEACDGSVATSVLQDWFLNRPLYAMPQPMRYDDPLVQEHCQREIEGCWKFIEEQYGAKFDWDVFVKYINRQNESYAFEHEKWDVAANTSSYPINGVAQALYRIFYSQYGDQQIWHDVDDHVRKIMRKTVANKIETLPKTRHRAIAWSCAPLYYSNWCTWAYNCWGINCVINMDSLMFDQYIRTDTYEHALEDLSWYNEKAPMRAMAVGGHEHIFQLWEYMERFNCDMVIMYDQLQCKGMQGVHGMFEDEFRRRDIHAIWVPHALPDKRTVSRKEIRKIISDYMYTVMREEPLDPTLVDFEDGNSW
ncbi:MAG: 2-hydroxyacyl-CoA dehydratase [Lachnospiraceae bacterium]|nr:2-hydroxyacyl-CoA dehydratase [Lachnospiraceae bacterium]